VNAPGRLPWKCQNWRLGRASRPAWEAQSTRGIIPPGQAKHPILRGIADGEIWGSIDVYKVRLSADSQALLLGRVIEGMESGDKPAAGSQNDPMMPVRRSAAANRCDKD
jgi:hypothetical protein